MSVDAETTPVPPAAPAGVPQPEPPRDEVDRLDPQPVAVDAQGAPLVLDNGAEFELEPLKLRQFLRMLRIITRGASQNMDVIDLDFEDPTKFVSGLMGLLVFAIPDAEDETVYFLQSVVKPKGLSEGRTKEDKAADDEAWERLFENLTNPSLDDTLTILQRLLEVEGEDLRALGKRVQRMFETATKMGALEKNRTVQTP